MSTRVNLVENDDEECAKPAELEASQGSLFPKWQGPVSLAILLISQVRSRVYPFAHVSP